MFYLGRNYVYERCLDWDLCQNPACSSKNSDPAFADSYQYSSKKTIHQAIQPLHGLLILVITSVVLWENLFVDKFIPFDSFYSVISECSSKTSDVILALRLKKIGLGLSSLEHNWQWSSLVGLGSIVAPLPPFHLSTKMLEL